MSLVHALRLVATLPQSDQRIYAAEFLHYTLEGGCPPLTTKLAQPERAEEIRVAVRQKLAKK